MELLLGAENLCGGLRAGLEGGFHATWKQFEEDLEVEAVFLMVAANAFNRLNREVLAQNCPFHLQRLQGLQDDLCGRHGRDPLQ